MAFGLPYARMGFNGHCQFLLYGADAGSYSDPDAGPKSDQLAARRSSRRSDRDPGVVYQPRVSSCDLKLSQSVQVPKITDIRYDKNVYTILPEKIEGNISYPIPLDSGSNGNIYDPTPELYELALMRNYQGRLSDFKVRIKHSHSGDSFLFNDCYINFFTYRADAGGMIDVEMSVWGKGREEKSFDSIKPGISRAATWQDVFVNLVGEVSISSSYFKRVEVTISNNLERIYTTTGKLTVKDLPARERTITGKLTLLGRHKELSIYSRTNPERCLEDQYLKFGYDAGCGKFSAEVPNIVCEIEEIAMTNDVIHTDVKWTSLPTDHDLYNLYRADSPAGGLSI